MISAPFSHTGAGELHVPRQEFIAEDKNKVEGAPAERKIVLGWLLDTRQLTINLPSHKFKAWTSQVESFLSRH